jgi:nitroreductase
MRYDQPITEIIRRRFSCRTYLDTPIEAKLRKKLEDACTAAEVGPFGTPARFKLVAAMEGDTSALRGLGTYGLIRGAMGFFLGAVADGDRDLEDFGYLMEAIVLLATDIGLGTCWLGGTFTRSSFSARMGLGEREAMPAVVSVGYISDKRGLIDRLIGEGAGAKTRHPWDRLFFCEHLGTPLSREAVGAYAVPLEMVRLGPSASNKQPWRIVGSGDRWHFLLERTPGYRERNSLAPWIADMQRIDMGIAMCHFELTAREAGLDGHWTVDEPPSVVADDRVEYTATWVQD